MRFHSTLLMAVVLFGSVLFSVDFLSGQSKQEAESASVHDDVFRTRRDKYDAAGVPHRFDGGKKETAQKYYDKVADQLNLPVLKTNKEEEPTFSLDKLLDWAGYTAVRALDLQELDSKVLMDTTTLEAAIKLRLGTNALPQGSEFAALRIQADPILSARYFSPKTSDVSGKSNKLSWRKAIRLLSLPKSSAANVGIAKVYFLSVGYVDSLERDPFAGVPVNVQVILSRDVAQPGKDSLYWLVFDPAKNFKLAFSTQTSWDAADPALERGLKDYHVPDACQSCHGRGGAATLHFFDTDHYLDRVQPDDDFEKPFLKSKWGPLFDGGRSQHASLHASASLTFKKLNSEIVDQMAVANPKSSTLRSARVWKRLHDTETGGTQYHMQPIFRAITNEDVAGFNPKDKQYVAKGAEWKRTDARHVELLSLLNRYCYRCHNGFKYNVFSKPEVATKKADLIDRIDQRTMPEDRTIDRQTRERFIELLKGL